MSYYFKSLWWGALLTPKCWGCALKRNPFMVLTIVIPMFFLCGLTSDALALSVCWLAGMILFIVTPRRFYKLAGKEKTLYVFIYDTFNMWKINVDDRGRSSIVRVFEKDIHENKLRKSGNDIKASGYSCSLKSSSCFLLIRLSYASWQLLGNGYNNDTSALILGHKLTNYAFADSTIAPKAMIIHLLHGRKVISQKVVSYEKCIDIELDGEHTFYTEIEDSGLVPFSAATVANSKGYFLLTNDGQQLKLYKVICEDNVSAAYLVSTSWFCIKKKGIQNLFCQDKTKGYIKSRL